MNVYPALLSLFSPYYQDRLHSLFSLHFYYNIYKKKKPYSKHPEIEAEIESLPVNSTRG